MIRQQRERNVSRHIRTGIRRHDLQPAPHDDHHGGYGRGIATVVLLLAYGAGFARAFEAIFAEFGTRLVGVFPGRTGEQAGGVKAGVPVRFTMDDLERLRATVPGLERISPMVSKDVAVQNELHTFTWSVNGEWPEIQQVMTLDLDSGRFFTDEDQQERNHVVVIGSEAKTKLFSGAYALGERIRLNGTSYTVIGILKPKMQEGKTTIKTALIVPFATMSDIKDTKYLDGIWFNYTGDHMAVSGQ